jgi:hypothetical protein
MVPLSREPVGKTWYLFEINARVTQMVPMAFFSISILITTKTTHENKGNKTANSLKFPVLNYRISVSAGPVIRHTDSSVKMKSTWWV